MKEQRITISESRKETVITERDYKTPQYLRNSQKKHNSKVDRIYADFPLGTKERIKRLGIEQRGPFIRSNILKILDILEKEYLSIEDDASESENLR